MKSSGRRDQPHRSPAAHPAVTDCCGDPCDTEPADGVKEIAEILVPQNIKEIMGVSQSTPHARVYAAPVADHIESLFFNHRDKWQERGLSNAKLLVQVAIKRARFELRHEHTMKIACNSDVAPLCVRPGSGTLSTAPMESRRLVKSCVPYRHQLSRVSPR